MKAELVPENGDPPIPIDRDLMVIGRRDYATSDRRLQPLEAALRARQDRRPACIRDLVSTNGTKVKGQKIRWAALLPEDRIALGSNKFRVYLGPDDVPGPSELYRTGTAGPPPPGEARAPSPEA